MENKRPYFPDLKLPPWRKTKLYELKSEAGDVIGSYCEFIHEQTGKLGVELRIIGSPGRIIIWEESVFLNSREAELKYIAYPGNSEWRKVRVKNLYPSRTSIEELKEGRKITVHFALVINGEADVQFLIKK